MIRSSSAAEERKTSSSSVINNNSSGVTTTSTINNNNTSTQAALSNNNNTNPRKQFVTLWDIVNESPEACELTKWPIQTMDGKRFESWLDFVFNPRISITCDRIKLIELLRQPLIIRSEERHFHQLAEYYWKLFLSDEHHHDGHCEIILKQGDVEVPGERTGLLTMKDQVVRWPWQRKLLFIAVCIYSTDQIQNLIPSKSTDITLMSPRLSGMLFSILYNFRVDHGKCVSFYPSPSNQSNFRQRVLANVMNYWDYEYRKKSGMVLSKPSVLERYKKQEKLYFLLLAYHAITHYQRVNSLVVFSPSVVYLGVLRMMFAIQQYGQGNESLSAVSWTQGKVYQKIVGLIPNFQLQDVSYIYRCARIINKEIKLSDTALQWITEAGKQDTLLHTAKQLLHDIPLTTDYVNTIKNSFNVTDRHLPSNKPHVTRYLSVEALQSKLVQSWEFELLWKIEQLKNKPFHYDKHVEKNWIYCIVEEQIAQQVKEYYEEIIMKLLRIHNGAELFLVADIFDPEIQNTAVLLMIPNRWLYLLQSVSWSNSLVVAVTGPKQYYHTGLAVNYDALGLAMMLFNLRNHDPIEWLIVVLRILLLKEPIEKVLRDMPELQIHAQTVNILVSMLYKQPVAETHKPLHDAFSADKTVLQCLKAQEEFSTIATFITILLLPFLTAAKIHKSNAEFLRNLLTYSSKGLEEKDKTIARAENIAILEKLSFKHSALYCTGAKPNDFYNLDMEAPATTAPPQGGNFGAFADILKIISHLRKHESIRTHTGTATVLALLGCVSPVLPHSQETLDHIFPALPKDSNRGGPFKLGTVPVAGKFTLHIPKPIQSTQLEETTSALFNHIINDFFGFQHSDFNTNWLKSQYPENDFRVPALHIDGSTFLSLCLPEFRHNGELVNPVYTSFLNSVPAREHKEGSYVALCQSLDKDMTSSSTSTSSNTNKRSQSVTPEHYTTNNSNKRNKNNNNNNNNNNDPPPFQLGGVATNVPDTDSENDEFMSTSSPMERCTSDLTNGRNVVFDQFPEDFGPTN